MCCFFLLFRDLLPWGCQLCFDSQMGWEISPAAESDTFFSCQGKSLTVISSIACQKGICLLLVKVPALHSLPLFGFLFFVQLCFLHTRILTLSTKSAVRPIRWHS